MRPEVGEVHETQPAPATSATLITVTGMNAARGPDPSSASGSPHPVNYGVHMEDSEVVAAIAAGDPAGLAGAYDKYAAPLYGYCRWKLRESASAAGALLETFVRAGAMLGTLQDVGHLRSWLYRVAREECYRRLRKAEAGFDETADEAGPPADVTDRTEQAEVRRLIRATLAELEPLEHEVIELSIRHNLNETELAVVLKVSWSRAHIMASRARDHLENALGALLIARTGRQACPELDALLADWNGRPTVQIGKLTAQHVEQCKSCAQRRPGALRPEMLSGLLPLAALPPGLRDPILLRAGAGSARRSRRPLVRRAGSLGLTGLQRVGRLFGGHRVEDASVEPGLSSDHQSLLKRIVIYIPSSIVPAMLALATSIIFTRIFNPVAYGKYSLFLVYAAPIELLFIEWLDQSIGKFLPPEQSSGDRRRVKDAIFLSIALIFFSEIVLAVAVLAIGNFFLAPEWRSFLLPTCLFVIVSSLFDVIAIVFAAESRARNYTSYQLLDSVATFGLRLLLVSAIFSMGTTLMFWSVIISHCFLLPIMWVQGGFPAPRRLALLLRSGEIRGTALAFLTFGLPMTIFFLSSVLLDVGDRYVLNFFMGPGPVGIYDANYRLIAGLVVLMVAPITITLHPHLMKIAGSGDTKTIEQMIGNVVETLLLVGALTVGLTFLFHKDIARVLLGHEFRAGSVVMPAVVAGVFFFNIGTFAHKPFEIVGRTRVMLVFGVIAAAANIGLCFALIPLLGYVGAAYATLLSYLLYTVCVGYLGRRIFPWRVNLRRLATYGGTIGSGVTAIHFLRVAMSGLPYALSLAVAVVASCVLASVFLLALLRPMLKPAGWRHHP